jgi:HlyD family secretion protein
LAQPELIKQLQQQRQKLATLASQSQTARSLQSHRSSAVDTSIAERQQSLESQIQITQGMTAQLKARLGRWQGLQSAGAVSREEVLKVQQEYLQSIEKTTDLRSQLREL